MKLNFLEQVPCIEVASFPNLTEDIFYKDYAVKLNLPNAKKYIELYVELRMERYGYLGSLPAEYTYEFNKISPDWQRKVITIGINDDLVILAMKRVQMFKYVYSRIDGMPISISGNRENELEVLYELAKYKLCHKISVNSAEKEIMDKLDFPFSEFVETYNFYSYVPSNFAKIDKNRWRTKKGINRMLRMSNLKMEILTGQSNNIDTISKGFDAWKIELEGVVFGKKLSKGIKKYKFWEDKNTIYYEYTYKGIAVGLCVYILANGIAHQIVNKAIGHMVFEQNTSHLDENELKELDEIRKRLNAYIHYTTIKNLNERGVEHAYFGGVFRTPSLRVFKRIMNDEEIPHHVYKLGEL